MDVNPKINFSLRDQPIGRSFGFVGNVVGEVENLKDNSAYHNSMC